MRYTYGSVEGVQAIVQAIPAEPLHCFRLSEPDQRRMASALETADIAGHDWAERYTGFGLEERQYWPGCLASMELDIHQLIGLVYALREAYDLGDEFAGDWLSALGSTVGVEWV
jgi:hypothetical protein